MHRIVRLGLRPFLEVLSSNVKIKEAVKLIESLILGINQGRMIVTMLMYDHTSEVYRQGNHYAVNFESDRSFECPSCKQQFSCVLEVMIHHTFIHIDECLKIFKTSENMLIAKIEKAPFLHQFPCIECKSSYPIRSHTCHQVDLFVAKIQHIFFELDITCELFIDLDPFYSKYYLQMRSKSIMERFLTIDEIEFEPLQSKNFGLKIETESDLYMESEDEEEPGIERNIATFRCFMDEINIKVKQAVIMCMFNKVRRKVRDLYRDFGLCYSLSKLNLFYLRNQEKIAVFEVLLRLAGMNILREEKVSLVLMFLVIGRIKQEDLSSVVLLL